MELQLLNSLETPIKTTLFPNNSSFVNEKGNPNWVKWLEKNFNKNNIEIKSVPYKLINRSKPYLINVHVSPLTWFSVHDDMLSEFPKDIKYDIMFGNGYLLLNSEWESYTKHFFRYLHEKLNLSDINPNKIIYLCNAVDVEKEYYLFCKDNNIPKNKQVITIYSQHNFNNIENFIVPPKEKIINNKPKKFLCLNRVAREHRLALAGLLSYHRLIDQSFYSLGASHADLKSCPAMTDQITTGLNAIKSRIPFILDTENLDINQNGWNSLPRAYYDNSYFSLISGTWAFKEQEPSRSINEKEYKAIMYKHPFILWTRPFTLKYLRQEGFMTFSKWFDESYDCEEDDLKRLEMIIMEVKRLCSLESYVLDNMVRDMENVLNYNYFNLIDRVVDRVYYHTDLKYLAKYAA